MRLIFSIFHLFTKCELVFLKKKFKNYGKNIKFGYLPTISNPNYISLMNNIIIGNNEKKMDFENINSIFKKIFSEECDINE